MTHPFALLKRIEGAVEASQPFGLLQDAGMPTAKMDEVVHQSDADLRAAVLHMVANEPRMAVEGLGNGVLETKSDDLGGKASHPQVGS